MRQPPYYTLPERFFTGCMLVLAGCIALYVAAQLVLAVWPIVAVVMLIVGGVTMVFLGRRNLWW